MLAAHCFTAAPASAGAQNLKCQNGFHKVATYSNSIKCKKAKNGFPTRQRANGKANVWMNNASCNAHMSPPKKQISKKNGKWKAKVTFICANIT